MVEVSSWAGVDRSCRGSTGRRSYCHSGPVTQRPTLRRDATAHLRRACHIGPDRPMKALVTGRRRVRRPPPAAPPRRPRATRSSAIDRSTGPDLADGDAVQDVLGGVRARRRLPPGRRSHVGGSWDRPRDTFRSTPTARSTCCRRCAAAGVGRGARVSSADVYGRVRARRAAPHRGRTRSDRSRPTRASKIAADYLAPPGVPRATGSR